MKDDDVLYHRLDRPGQFYGDRTDRLRNVLYILILIVLAACAYVIYTDRALYSNANMTEMEREIIRLKSLVGGAKKKADYSAVTVPQLRKRPEVADVNCKRIFDGDVSYTKSLAGEKRRKIVPANNLDMGCNAIRQRILPARNPSSGYPMAYAKVVHENYEFLEEQLAVTYSEENWYCFAPDVKATPEFHSRFTQLAFCLPNVVLAGKEYKTDSAGHYHTHAFFDCLRHLQSKDWNYIIFLQNNDIMIKSNREIIRIMQTMNGANDIELMQCSKDGRCDNLETNLGKLDLCPTTLNASDRNTCGKKNVTWGKGSVQVTLSRRTADFLTDNVDYQPLQDELNKNGYGIDEVFLQTLIVTKELGIPGSYPYRCLDEHPVSVNKHIFMTRLTHWGGHDDACGSGYWRHGLCVFGVEDLPYLSGVDYTMANKLMSDFDYAAISCIGELLYNRTWLGQDDHPLNIPVYENLPLVRLHKLEQTNPANVDALFKCPVLH